VWRPDEATLEHANATRLLRRSGAGSWDELQRRSWQEPEWFWPLCVEDLGLEFSRPWQRVLDDSSGPEWATWFEGGEVSIARNCVHRWAERRPGAVAAVGLGEDGSRRELTFAELSRDVTRLAEHRVALGVEPGDRVGIFLPMSPEVAVASHAVAHVGGSRVPVINCTGGTEVGACFLSPTPAGPIKACSVGGPALGMAMDVVADDGSSLVGTGEVGELVCRAPFPGMTRGFWRDPDKFVETYWSRLPGVWVHGDWASVDEDGFWFLHGRSDDTLNIAGKRIGPAELESAAVDHPAVREAAAIGVPHEVKGETAWIFCCLLPDANVTEADVAAHVGGVLGKAFRPERVFFVDALPKTRSAKIVRRAVKAKALGTDPGDLSSLENPEALDAIGAAVA
jgi:acyl-coenzyme A synthetase/AMP-(fatty) acid ligase